MSDRTLPTAMDHNRALEIVSAINARAFLAMDLAENLDGRVPLAEVTLRQMLDATAMVEAENERRRAESTGSYSTHVVPAERLIAAVYVIENYEPSGTAIVASIKDGGDQLLAVFHANSGSEGDAS